jgi:hypothetical protein
MTSKTRPNRRRRARAWAKKHGKVDPHYVACPACSAKPGESCRAIREAFHPERIAAAKATADSRPTRASSPVPTVNLARLDRRPYLHRERRDTAAELTADEAARLADLRRVIRRAREIKVARLTEDAS